MWGLDRGYCMMIGGDADAVVHLNPTFAALAPGWGDILRNAANGRPEAERYGFDLANVAEV